MAGSEGDGTDSYGLRQRLELVDKVLVAVVVEVGDHVTQRAARAEHLAGDVDVVVAGQDQHPLRERAVSLDRVVDDTERGAGGFGSTGT